MNIKECLEQGLLKRTKIDKEKINKELEESERDFKDGKSSVKMKKFKWAIIQFYYSMFHSARAVLFSIGYKERRHFAITVVLDDLVKKKKLESKFVSDLKAAMFVREEADYRAKYSKERAEKLAAIANEFNQRMKKLLKQKIKNS